jgi:hypothetical protein
MDLRVIRTSLKLLSADKKLYKLYPSSFALALAALASLILPSASIMQFLTAKEILQRVFRFNLEDIDRASCAM